MWEQLNSVGVCRSSALQTFGWRNEKGTSKTLFPWRDPSPAVTDQQTTRCPYRIRGTFLWHGVKSLNTFFWSKGPNRHDSHDSSRTPFDFFFFSFSHSCVGKIGFKSTVWFVLWHTEMEPRRKAPSGRTPTCTPTENIISSSGSGLKAFSLSFFSYQRCMRDIPEQVGIES